MTEDAVYVGMLVTCSMFEWHRRGRVVDGPHRRWGARPRLTWTAEFEDGEQSERAASDLQEVDAVTRLADLVRDPPPDD